MALDLDDLTYRVRIDNAGVDASAGATVKAIERLNGPLNVTQRNLSALSTQSRGAGNSLARVSNQVQDFAIQVSSGQSAVTAFLQQGSQLYAQFGGVGGALRAVGSLFTVTSVAIASGAAVVGSLGYAYAQAITRQTEFQRYLVLTGNSAGVTAGQINQMADSIAASTGVSVATARELVTTYADSGKVGSAALESIARATARLAQLSGKDAADVRKEFEGLFDKPAAAALKLNERYNFLTADTAKLIVELQKQGKEEQAVKLVADELDKALKARSTTIGVQIGLWERLKVAASNALNNISRSFDAPTTQDQTKEVVERIQVMRSALANSEARGDNQEVITRRRTALAALTQQYHALFEVQKAEGVAATQAAAAAEKATEERTKVGKILGDADKKTKAAKGPKADYFNDAQDKLEDQIRERLDKIAESESVARDRELAKDIEAYRRRSEAGQQFGQQLTDQTATINAGLLTDAQARGEALLAIERAQATARLEALNLEGEEYSRLWSALQGNIAARQAQLTEELKPEYQRQLELFQNTTQYMKQAHDQFVEGFISTGRDMFAEWVSTGKLNTQRLVQYMTQSFAKLAYDRYLASLVGEQGKSSFSLFEMLLNGSGGSGLTIDTGGYGITNGSTGSLVELGLGAGRAAGGPVRRGNLYPVNELGTEMLTMNGRDYLMAGANGKVTPADKLGGGAPIVNVTQNLSIGAGVNASQLGQAMQQAKDQAKAEIAEQLRRGGRGYS